MVTDLTKGNKEIDMGRLMKSIRGRECDVA